MKYHVQIAYGNNVYIKLSYQVGVSLRGIVGLLRYLSTQLSQRMTPNEEVKSYKPY